MRPITSVDHETFLGDALGDPTRAGDSYGRACSASDSTAKVILHQTTRLVSLADWMDEATPSRPALKIFFFVVLAEAIVKMAFAFSGEGQSKAYVHRFFAELCLFQDREKLGASFRRTDSTRPRPAQHLGGGRRSLQRPEQCCAPRRILSVQPS